MTGVSDHVRKDRLHRQTNSAAYQAADASQLNRWGRLAWGVWDIPEDETPTRDMHRDRLGLRRADLDDPDPRTQDLIEPLAAADAATIHQGYAPLAWFRAFPSEQIWKVRKRPHAADVS